MRPNGIQSSLLPPLWGRHAEWGRIDQTVAPPVVRIDRSDPVVRIEHGQSAKEDNKGGFRTSELESLRLMFSNVIGRQRLARIVLDGGVTVDLQSF